MGLISAKYSLPQQVYQGDSFIYEIGMSGFLSSYDSIHISDHIPDGLTFNPDDISYTFSH